MKRLDHPHLYTYDLPYLERVLGPERFAECLQCIDRAIAVVMRNPSHEGAALTRPPLEIYRKKKFHSMLNPPRHVRPDLQVVYRYDATTDTLWVLGIGLRRPHSEDDVYVRVSPHAIGPVSE